MLRLCAVFFFFNATATTEIYTLSLHDALPICENADNKLYGNLGHLAPKKASRPGMQIAVGGCLAQKDRDTIVKRAPWVDRSEEHTSELQSQSNLVCRLLLEKKKKKTRTTKTTK